MGFWAKIGNFFKGFFGNIAADPVSTMSGVGKIVAGGAAAYGMATGVIPANTVSGTAVAGMIMSGVVSLGTNHTTGVVDPTIAKVAAAEEKGVNVALAIDPLAKQVSEAIKAAGDQASTAAKIAAAAQAVQAITAAIPESPKEG